MLSHFLRAVSKRPPLLVSSLVTTGGGASIAANAPSNISANNLLIAVINANGTGSTITVPSGWTSVNLAPNRWTAYKTATGSEPASYTFSFTSALSTITATLVNYSGGLIDVIGVASNAGTDLPAPSINVSQGNSVVVLAVTSNTSSNTVVTPSEWSVIATTTASSAQSLYARQFNAGATGDIAQDGTSTGARAALLSIKPS